jgi:hypothetical protein
MTFSFLLARNARISALPPLLEAYGPMHWDCRKGFVYRAPTMSRMAPLRMGERVYFAGCGRALPTQFFGGWKSQAFWAGMFSRKASFFNDRLCAYPKERNESFLCF